MIVFTILFDALMAFTAINFAKHVTFGTIMMDLFGVVSAADKGTSEIVFEWLLYFAVMCLIELFVISRFATLRGVAFYPKDFKDERENLEMCKGNHVQQKLVIAVGFIGLMVVNAAIYIFL